MSRGVCLTYHSFQVKRSMKRLSVNEKLRIIRLVKNGKSQHKASRDIGCDRRTIKRWTSRFNSSGSVVGRRRPTLPTKATPLITKCIDFLQSKNDELTSPRICAILKENLGINLSKDRVNVVRRRLGWQTKRTKYCQLIKNKNKQARMDWCLHMFRQHRDFTDVIFSDESSIQLNIHGRIFFYRSDADGIPKKPKPKHPLKVHVWAGISCRGRTGICIFENNMRSVDYQMILEKNLLPFANRAYPEGYYLYQDNDSKHTSKSTKMWMEKHHVRTLTSPAESPDINVIECVWSAMKQYLELDVKPTTKDALVRGIRSYWQSLTPEKCAKFIGHIHKVLPVVILKHGGPSGY